MAWTTKEKIVKIGYAETALSPQVSRWAAFEAACGLYDEVDQEVMVPVRDRVLRQLLSDGQISF